MKSDVEQPFQSELIAGDTWSWSITLSDYDPALYTLKFFFRGPGTLDVTATADTTGVGTYAITVTPDQTAGLAAGQYAWSACVFDQATPTPNRTELGRGSVLVLADVVAQTAGTDQRSYAQQCLDKIEAVLLNRNGRIERTYQINGRMLSLMDPDKLREERGYWLAQVRKEQIEDQQLDPNYNKVQAAFADPSGPPGVWR